MHACAPACVPCNRCMQLLDSHETLTHGCCLVCTISQARAAEEARSHLLELKTRVADYEAAASAALRQVGTVVVLIDCAMFGTGAALQGPHAIANTHTLVQYIDYK